MITLLVAFSAQAQDVHAIEWAQPFELTEAAEAWTMHPEREPVSRGWLVQLRVDPEALIPTQVAMPVLFAGDVVPSPTNYDYVEGCGLYIVPGALDLATTPLFFGSTELPERLDRAKREKILEASTATPFPLPTLQPVLRTPDMRGVVAAADARIKVCGGLDENAR